jgi:predicted house-cleaning noncanonical NTP pyrophosphatase (MazG superfamily)
MRKEHNKLVRDFIPEMIRNDGRACEVEIMKDNEYRQALLRKIVEEAHEVAAADLEQLPTELADLYEVIDAVMEDFKIERDTVLSVKDQRRAERGGFSQKYRLVWSQ